MEFPLQLKLEPTEKGKYGIFSLIEKTYSDSLLMFLLKANRVKYREHVVQEHTGKDGKPIQVQDMEAIRQNRWTKAAVAIAMATGSLPMPETETKENGNA